ncbi:MAG: HlyD family secretion protein [Rhodospirillaceae bacterium]|nr:MAG: HlyD family secretion protein [Rhodospirillaceae bacterium]
MAGEHTTGHMLVPQAGQSVRIRRAARQSRYLAQSIVLEETGTALLVRLSIVVIAGVVLAFVTWAAWTRVEEMAITFGQVIPSGQVRTLQHLEGGIVQDVLVREGEKVTPGQVLVRLSPTQALADLEQTVVRIAGLDLRGERLRAIGEDRAPDLTTRQPRYQELAEGQKAVYESQRAARHAQQAILNRQIEQKQFEWQTVIEQQNTTRQQLDLTLQAVAMREELLEKGLGSKVSYLDARQEQTRLEGENLRLVHQARIAEEALREAEGRLVDLDARLRQDALNELSTVMAELAQLNEVVVRSKDRMTRLDITTPLRGLVQRLRITGGGAVVPAGGAVVDIVPVEDTLMVETRITTRDAGHVQAGQSVTVKVTAFDFARFGAAKGTLAGLSPTTYMDEQNKPYYRALVTLHEDYVGDARRQILPGMTVQADIITGDKTVLEYLLKPIYTSIQSGLHER